MLPGCVSPAGLAALTVVLSSTTTACSRPPDYAHLEGPPCNSVGLRMEKDLPLIDVAIDGTPLSRIVDTGSVQSITLLPEEITELRLSLNGRERTVRDAQGNALISRGVTIPELRIGEMVFRNVAGWEAVHAPGWQPPVRAGHLGRALMSALRVTIDEPDGWIHLDTETCQRPILGAELPAEFTSNGVISPARLDGSYVELLWDTAATASMMKSSDAFEIQKRPPALLESIGPLPLQLEVVPTHLDGFPADGLIGTNAFREWVVTFDFLRGKLFVEENAPQRRHLPSLRLGGRFR